MQLMPTGFSRSCSFLVICVSSATAPRTTSLAGALCTPRLSSLRPQMPAMCPLGGTKMFAGRRVEDLDPRPVERRELGVVAGLVDPPLLDLLRVEAGRRVEDRDAVAHQLAVGDHRQLDRLHGLEVDGPAGRPLIRSGTQTMVTSSMASRPAKPVRSATSPT